LRLAVGARPVTQPSEQARRIVLRAARSADRRP